MTMISRFAVLTILALGLTHLIAAQEGISSAGGDLSGSGGSISFTVGQTAYSFISAPEGSVNEGIQQPMVGMMVGIDPSMNMVEATLYPNPVSNELTIDFGQSEAVVEADKLHYSLSDIFGHPLRTGVITGHRVQVPVKALQQGVYLLAIQYNNRIIQTFRIIKVD